MVKHSSNFVRVQVCSLAKINKLVFEEKCKNVMSKELKNKKEIKDTNKPDTRERIVSVVEDIAEAQDENNEITIEISFEVEEVDEDGEEEEWDKEEQKNNEGMQEKGTEVIEQPIAEESELMKNRFRSKKYGKIYNS